MASPSYAILFQALVSGVSGVGAAGDVLVLNTAGSAFIISTTANRGTRRSTGVALKPYTNNSTVEIQQYGQVDASLVPALGAGTASWVRVSTTGQLERATVSGSDDVCGYVETDGTFHACFGILTAAIVNGSGGGGGATLPIDLAGGAGTVINVLPIANQAAQTMAGDVTGTTAASVVAKVNGATYPAAGALVTGTVPRVTGTSAVAYGALDLANASAITGVLPSASAPSHAGDVTGAHTATVVVKVNGASVPAAGSLTTGNIPQVSGASALTYGPLNLAGGSNFVTGSLPIGNLAAPTGTGFIHVTSGAYDAATVGLTFTGDTTGTGTAASIALTTVKINGASVPAGGGLTTGNGLYVTGAATLTYSALNLAGGGTYVTGILPTANQASQTMAGDVTGTTAASVVAKINGATVPAAGALTTGHVLQVSGVSATTYGFVANANVATAAAIVGTKITPDFGSQNVFTTGYMAFGTPVAAVGSALRLAASLSTYAKTSGTDRCLWEASDATLYLGNNASNASQFSTINIYGGGTGVNLGGNSSAATYLQLNSDTIFSWKPITGSSVGSSPYSVHGKTTVATTGSFTVAAADYALDAIQFTSAAGGTVTFPLPAADAAAYYKTIIYSGNGSLVVTNGGGAPKNVTLATNTTMRCLFDTAGVHPLSGSAGAYP